MIHALQNRLSGKLPRLVFLLFVIQPLMDVLSFWIQEWGVSNMPTLLLRFGVLAAMALLGFTVSRHKKVYFIAAGVFLLLGGVHIFACVQAGYQDIFLDMSNYLRVLQLPITTLCLITFLREDNTCYCAVKLGITANVLLILLVQVLAIVTNTDPHTYPDGSGYIGWFSFANTQSAILTIAAPVAIVWLYQKRGLKNIFFWIAFVGSCLSLFFIGTRLAYAGILAICFGLGVSMVIVNRKQWRQAAVFVLVGALFVALLPYAPMSGHRSSHSDEMSQKQEWLEEQLQTGKDNTDLDDGPPAFPTDDLVFTEEELALIEELAPVYEHYVSDFVSIFGVERTIQMFGFTKDILEMTHVRTKKLMFAEFLMEHSPASSQWFGLELGRFTCKGRNFDVENDFHGIYYLHGIVGLAAMILFLGYFLFLIAKALITNFKRFFTLETAAWGIGLVLCLGHCVFTAGVLRRPNASFYMAAILAVVYYLIKLKDYPEKEV